MLTGWHPNAIAVDVNSVWVCSTVPLAESWWHWWLCGCAWKHGEWQHLSGTIGALPGSWYLGILILKMVVVAKFKQLFTKCLPHEACWKWAVLQQYSPCHCSDSILRRHCVNSC